MAKKKAASRAGKKAALPKTKATRPRKERRKPADTGHIDFLEYLSGEHKNLLVSIVNFREEFEAFSHVDGLYQAAVIGAVVPDQHLVPMQMLLFVHYQLYSSTSSFFRTHMAEAFTALRIAIESALQGYRILQGGGTAEGFIQGEETFKYTVNHVGQARKKDTTKYPLAEPLIKLHEACSKHAAHADIDAFAYRVNITPRGKDKLLTLNYLQFDPDRNSFAVYFITILEVFAYILLVFDDFLVNTVKVTPKDWSIEVQRCGAALARMKAGLQAKAAQQPKPK